MPYSDRHLVFIKRALKLAIKGRYTTSPNPSVGCVLVKNNEIIGEGWHISTGKNHAEVNALLDAKVKGNSTEGATAYITLEPCFHHGKTPPCTEALVNAQIKHVVVGILDCDPRTQNKGLEYLASQGIETTLIDNSEVQQEIKQLLQGYICRQIHQKPFITLKIASSLDGKVALKNGQSQWITGELARKNVHFLRSQQDAILTTSKTVISDDPLLSVRLSLEEKKVLKLPPEDRHPLVIIVDSKLSIPLNSKVLLTGRKTLIFCSNQLSEKAIQHFSQQCEQNIQIIPVFADVKGLNLNAIMDYLGNEKINNLMVEAGATFNGSLIKNNLVNELIIYMGSKLLGDQAQSSFIFSKLNSLTESIHLKINSIEQFSNDLCVKASVIQ